jgi:hypothetical protein
MVEAPESMEFEPESGEYVIPDAFDAPGELHTTVVAAVAAATDTDSDELENLYERVDPDAFGRVFEPHPDGTRRFGGRLSFPLSGAVVTLHSEGELRIEP